MNRLKGFICLFVILCGFGGLQAQVPLNTSATFSLERELLKSENHHIHSGIKPYNHFVVGEIIDSIHTTLRFDKQIDKKFKSWLFDAVFNDNFLEIKDKNNKYSLKLNPLMDFRVGLSSDVDNLPYVNSRGIQLMGHIGKKMTFYSDLYETQASYSGYVNEYIFKNTVVPGEGFPKQFKTIAGGISAFDFAYATGNITYQPNEFFNFQFGHGKNFIGEGHRSLLLSDNAFNYPYLKIQTSFWKINYTNLFTQMRDIKGNVYVNADFEKKYIMSHYLSLDVTKKFNIGLFESVVYQDSTGRLDLNFLNPVILYRPVEFAIGSKTGNVLFGITMSYKIKEKAMFYSQIMIDEFKFDEVFKGDGWWANKFAFQLGFKSYDSFIPGLKLQTELNYARPFIYSHENSGRNYGHYNQAIAHPLGSNFIESVSTISYQKGRWFGNVELMYALQGQDSIGTNVGTDIFMSYDTNRDGDYDHSTLQGIKSTTLFADLRVGYLINPKTNLKIELGMTYRSFKPELETANLKNSNTTYIHFGITTALNNKYYDF